MNRNAAVQELDKEIAEVKYSLAFANAKGDAKMQHAAKEVLARYTAQRDKLTQGKTSQRMAK